jgi:RNA polymerase sigma-70 factor (ECF subfamily)
MLAKASHSEIWMQLQSGNQQALLALYDRHYIGLLNYGMKLTGNRELTRDCITQILLRLWDSRQKLPPVENVRSYLLTCLRRELISELKGETTRSTRNQKVQKTLSESELPYEEYLIQVQTNEALREKLMKAFEKLTQREKELLRLRFFEDLDYDEIAAQCSITKRTAYNIIHTAIKALKADFVYRPSFDMVYKTAAYVLTFLAASNF